MTGHKDITRWNRAGLHRVSYIDGNAPLYLDRLRAALKDRFANSVWARLPVPQEDAGVIEREVAQYQRNRKIVDQYHDKRRDLGWEIARTVARSSHVLTGHVDAHANEAFIRTATQWDNLRRLVELIDYHPAAATSAATELVLMAKPGRRGTVKKGLQVKYTPAEDGPTVVFETIADLEIDPDLNALRPSGWDRSEDTVAPAASSATGAITTRFRMALASRTFGGFTTLARTRATDTGTAAAGPLYPPVAMGPASNIQGVGTERAKALDTLTGGAPDSFLIKDFLALDPANPGLATEFSIPETMLRELRAKAIALATFELEADWAPILDWTLARIAATPADELAAEADRTVAEAEALKLRMDLFATYLTQEVYGATLLRALLPPAPTGKAAEVATPWKAPKKPPVRPGEVAMVFDEAAQIGAAVTIARVEEADQGGGDG